MLELLGFWLLVMTLFGVLIAAHYAQVCARELKGIREVLDRQA